MADYAALNEAVEEEVLVRNPALNIKVSNAKKKSLAKKIVFFSLEESREFLKFVYGKVFQRDSSQEEKKQTFLRQYICE